jgi:hypothetical protein
MKALLDTESLLMGWWPSALFLTSQLLLHLVNLSLECLLATGKTEHICKKHDPDQGVSREQVIHRNSLEKF